MLAALLINVLFTLQNMNLYECLGIMLAILVSAFVSTISEYGSENAFEKMLAAGEKQTAYVFRNSELISLSLDDIVVGDMVLIEAGIGGKFSSGNDTPIGNQDGTFIDNVSLEYRLDQTAMRYVRLFYNKEADDLLEDRISEYGAGFVWRKKLDSLSDLFKSNNQILLRTSPKATAEGEKKEK